MEDQPWRDRLPSAIRRIGPWRLALALVIVWWVWNFTHTMLRTHHGLGTGNYDLGLHEQGVWLLSRLEAPFVTLMGRNLFGDHASFVLLLLAPVFRLFPATGTLFFVHVLALAAGSIPVWLLARRLLQSEAAATVLAVGYLAGPAPGGISLEHFHPDAFLPFLVGMAIWFAHESRWAPYWVFVALALLVKEDVALVMIPVGVWVAWRRNRRVGLATVGASVAASAAGILVIYALTGVAFPNSWRLPFGGFAGLLAATLTRPWEVVAHAFEGRRLDYLWQLTASFGGIFLRAPEIALTSSLVLASNLLSTFPYQHDIEFHYTAAALPGLAMGTVYAVGRFRAAIRPFVLGFVLSAAMVSGYLWGDFAFSRAPELNWYPDHPNAVAARELIPLVPGDSSVAAHWSITPHLARRREVYMFPTPFSALLYGPPGMASQRALEGMRLPQADTVEYVFISIEMDEEQAAVWAQERDAFELVAGSGPWELWRRR
ncbi:MAG: DUF2079 domain-containing protein [Acidimicrobiia bacterium]|nr:MAG: DUF2079 domain-containing protein [Acidimicrobiia bacterium]